MDESKVFKALESVWELGDLHGYVTRVIADYDAEHGVADVYVTLIDGSEVSYTKRVRGEALDAGGARFPRG